MFVWNAVTKLLGLLGILVTRLERFISNILIGNFENQLGCEEKLQVVIDKEFQLTPEYFMLQLKIFSNFKRCYKTIYSLILYVLQLVVFKDELILLDTIHENTRVIFLSHKENPNKCLA